MCNIKSTKISFDHKEINKMKKKTNDISSTLSKCTFDKNRLEFMFQIEKTPKDITHATRYLTMHTYMLKCTNIHVTIKKAIWPNFAMLK